MHPPEWIVEMASGDPAVAASHLDTDLQIGRHIRPALTVRGLQTSSRNDWAEDLPVYSPDGSGSHEEIDVMKHSRPLTAALIAATGTLAACGGSSGPGGGGSSSILIALNVPSSADPYVAQVIERGAQLAVREANQTGVTIAGRTYRVSYKIYDDAGQPQQSAGNVQTALHDGAVAVIEDGLGASVSAAASDATGVPEIVITNGDAGLLDPQKRPSVFRVGIANDAASNVLGRYIAGKASSVAIVHDDSETGRDGATQILTALGTASVTAKQPIEVAAGAPTLDAQVAELAAGNPGAIVIWGGDAFVGRMVHAIRSAGVSTPLFSGPSGSSPAVRALAGNAASDGLHLVTSRMTSESDAASFGQFEHRLATAGLGPTDAGFKNTEGQEVRQPNDVDFFSYDAVNLVIAAIKKQNSVQPGAGLLRAIGQVKVTSANGDTRGFNPMNHEGVSDDDMYIAVIHDMQFQPVKDEPLSATLPTEDQILADFH